MNLSILKDKKNMFFLAGALIVATAVFYYKISENSSLAEVKKGDIIEELAASGTVVTSDDVSLSFERSGIVDSINFKVGDEVSSKDVLASLKSKELEAELLKYDAQIDVAKAKLSQLLAGTRSEELDLYESQLALAQTELDAALKNFENVKIKADNDLEQDYQNAANLADSVLLTANIATDVLNSIYQPSNKFQPYFFISDFGKKSDAEWQIIFTKDALKKIKETYDILKGSDLTHEKIDEAISNFKLNMEIIRVALNKTSEAFDSATVVSGTKSLNDYKSDVARAKASLNSSQNETLSRYQAIDSQKIENTAKIEEANNLVDTKRAQVREKEEELALKKAQPRDVEIAVYEAEIKEARASRVLTQQEIENSDLIAPAPGIVKEIKIRKGESVTENNNSMIIAPVSEFQIEAYVLKDDISKIKIGDKASVFLPQEGGEYQNITGSVVDIDQNQEVKDGDNTYAKVYVAIFDKNINIALNEKVSLVINATVKKQALSIPKSALIKEGEKTYVDIYENGKSKKIEVKIGEVSIDSVEIESGLYEGDRVVIH